MHLYPVSGKTTLAVRWAHRVAHHFPDGQLYVNLRGFDPSGQALDPGAAVRGFLDALGIPGDRIPTGLDAQIGLYRSLLSGNRILVVLDNARHVEQVRPLLPATPGCLAIVTSRHHLTPLVVTEGAHPLTLDVLTAAEAHDLLIHRLGADRVAGEPDAVDKIIARCARLPLALAIVAARAATHPSFPLNAIVAELVAPASRLDALHGGDPATDLRAVFACSYQTLSAGAARMFRLLGLHPGPDTGTPAAASLAAIPVDQARQLLAELVQAHLLTEHTPGRYTFHDLLRGYATDQAQTRDSDHDRHAARCRLLDHYLHTAHRARMLLSPSRQPITLTPPQPGVTPEPIGDHDHALAWLAAEYTVLHAATEQAATCRFDNHAWQLAWAMRTFANWQGLWHEQIAIDHTALAATSRLGDMFAGARTLDGLASSYFRSRRLVDAETHYRQALDLYTELGDLAGQAEAHSGMSLIAESECRLVDGLWHVQREVDLLRTSGDRARYAMSLNNLGMLQALLGNYQQALSTCSQALTLLQEHADLQAEGLTWDSLGYAHRGLADYAQSVSCYRRAIDLFQRAGDRYNDADSHIALGDTCQAAGDTDAAHAAWKHAAHVFEQLNHTDVQRARAKLMSGPPTRQESQPRR